jgi:hypothetical protein
MRSFGEGHLPSSNLSEFESNERPVYGCDLWVTHVGIWPGMRLMRLPKPVAFSESHRRVRGESKSVGVQDGDGVDMDCGRGRPVLRA